VAHALSRAASSQSSTPARSRQTAGIKRRHQWQCRAKVMPGVTINLMTKWAVLIAAAGLCLSANAAVTLTGVVGDDMCGMDHTKMGGTDAAKCAAECAKGMGAKYSLVVGADQYVLSDQAAGVKYIGKKVTVTGDVTTTGTGKDTVKTLKVTKIAAAK
jgi:hypothetical protein